MVAGTNPDIARALLLLDDHLLRFALERSLKIAIACAGSTAGELAYLRGKFSDAGKVFPNNTEKLMTYRLMQASRLVVTNWSTAGIEALGWGKKVLFCNFSDDAKVGFPTPGPWRLVDRSYAAFADAMTTLRYMPDEEYLELSSHIRQMHMNYPSQEISAGEIVRRAVVKGLESNFRPKTDGAFVEIG